MSGTTQRRLLQDNGAAIPLPSWLTTSFKLVQTERLFGSFTQLHGRLSPQRQITISKDTPVLAIGQYVVQVASRTPGSDAATVVRFTLNVVDYYQLTVTLLYACKMFVLQNLWTVAPEPHISMYAYMCIEKKHPRQHSDACNCIPQYACIS